MKIAILVGGLPPAASGGTEIATLAIAHHAAKAGHEVHVIARDHLRQGAEVYKAAENGFQIHRITAPNLPRGRDLIYTLKALKVLSGLEPDLVHAQAMYMCMPALIFGAIRGTPWIFFERGGVYMHWRFNRVFYPLFMRNATRVIAQTEHQKQELLKYCRREIEIIPNGVDMERFGKLTRHQARVCLGLPHDRRIVLSVGRARREKNLSVFIQAANLDPENLYVLVGDGPELPQLKAMANGNMIFAGVVDRDKIPVYMAAADVYVNTSKSEGFPNAILEAMAAGLPVVAPGLGGLMEIIKAGYNGFLSAPNSPRDTSDCVRIILRNDELYTKMSEANKLKAKEYTWDSVVRKLYG